MKKIKAKSIAGATMTEYVLLIGLIAAGAILALTNVGTTIATFFTNLSTRITNSGSNL